MDNGICMFCGESDWFRNPKVIQSFPQVGDKYTMVFCGRCHDSLQQYERIRDYVDAINEENRSNQKPEIKGQVIITRSELVADKMEKRGETNVN